MHTINRLYVIYDAKAEETMGNPFMYRADAAAIRGFKELMTDPKQFFHRHPEDYSLLYLGTLNCKDGAMPYIEAQTMLVSAGKEAQQEELPLQLAK